MRCRQGEGHGDVAVAQGFLPSGEVGDLAQGGIAPGVGAIKEDDLVALVQHNVPRLGGDVGVAGGEGLA